MDRSDDSDSGPDAGRKAVGDWLPPEQGTNEGLGLLRLLIVISSFWPLFVLWAIRGTPLVDDRVFAVACFAAIAVPHLVLAGRIWLARHRRLKKTIVIGSSQSNRDHVLVYLFATLLPFFSLDISHGRELAALLAAFAFVVLLFWILRLHYINLLFEAAGYHAFTVLAPDDGNPLTYHGPQVVITKRQTLPPGKISTYMLTNGVYLEKG